MGRINWTVDVGTSATTTPGDSFLIDGSAILDDTDLNVSFGVSGVDLNNDGDLDVAVSNFETYTVEGSPLNTPATTEDDNISGAGSTATGAAFASGLVIDGNGGDDTLAGGAGADDVDGEGDDDTVSGGLGNDVLSGGAGTFDTVDYSASATAVTVVCRRPRRARAWTRCPGSRTSRARRRATTSLETVDQQHRSGRR